MALEQAQLLAPRRPARNRRASHRAVGVAGERGERAPLARGGLCTQGAVPSLDIAHAVHEACLVGRPLSLRAATCAHAFYLIAGCTRRVIPMGSECQCAGHCSESRREPTPGFPRLRRGGGNRRKRSIVGLCTSGRPTRRPCSPKPTSSAALACPSACRQSKASLRSRESRRRLPKPCRIDEAHVVGHREYRNE